jgi:hypothetical protein
VRNGVSDTLSAWLREQRLAHSWSVAEMGRQLQHAAKTTRDHTVPSAATLAAYIRRWETGRSGITERYRLHYCTAFGLQPAGFGPLQPAPEPQDDLVGIVVSGAGTALPADPDVLRGVTLPYWSPKLSGYGETRTEHNAVHCTGQQPQPDSSFHLMTVIAQESLDFGEWVAMSEVGDATIERYAAHIRQLSRDFEYAAPLPLFLETRRLRDRIASQLRGHQRLDQTRDLYLVAAQVCGLLAWMSGDLSNYHAADTHAWTAWLCAEQAGHDGARAWVRATQSKLAYWDGRYSESTQLAEDGLRYEHADTAGTLLALFQARALAHLGRRAEATQALTRADTERERAADADLVGGIWSVAPERFHNMAAGTYMLLDQPRQVLAEASRAVTLAESAPSAEQHLYTELHARMDQAEAHLREPDLDAVSVVLRPVLDLPPDSRNDPVTKCLARLDAALTAPSFAGSQQAHQLQEEIEIYRAEAIPRQIGA